MSSYRSLFIISLRGTEIYIDSLMDDIISNFKSVYHSFKDKEILNIGKTKKYELNNESNPLLIIEDSFFDE